MQWVLLGFLLMGLLAYIATELAWKAMNKPEPPTPACEHPWYIDGRCIVCGHPR